MWGQGLLTRAAAFLEGLDQRQDQAVTKYQDGWVALLHLWGPGEWENHLKVLNPKKDIASLDGMVFMIDIGDGSKDFQRLCYGDVLGNRQHTNETSV